MNKFKKSLQLPPTEKGIDKQTETISDFFKNANEQYINTNSNEVKEYLSYLMAGIFLTYKKLYPDLSIYIPFRIKSDNSVLQNYKKELTSALNKYDSKNNSLDLSSIFTDFMAGTIVLDHIKNSRKTKTEYESTEISKLRKTREDTLHYINEIEQKIDDSFIDEKEFLNIKRELLNRIIESTYPEFTNERPISYQTELNELDRNYKIKQETESFEADISDEQMAELKNLLLDLRSRSSDKLEYEILRETAPKVFDSPLLKNALHVNSKFIKDSKKPNGFAAIYYVLETPYGPIEIQLQSNKRYYEAKKGSAYHSGLNGKRIDISSFFELANPDDEHDLKFYLTKLDSIRADKILSDVEIPNFETEADKYKFLNSPEGKDYDLSLQAKEYMSHIKIKDSLSFYNAIDPTSDSNAMQQVDIPTDTYLLALAESVSPDMNVCSSGHTSFSIASIQQKNLIGEFTEILRRRDYTSCLGNMLINRLRSILQKENYQSPFENSLPRDIAREDIIRYATSILPKRLKDREEALNNNSEELTK